MSNGKKFMSAKTEFTTCTYGSIPQKIYIERSHGVINSNFAVVKLPINY